LIAAAKHTCAIDLAICVAEFARDLESLFKIDFEGLTAYLHGVAGSIIAFPSRRLLVALPTENGPAGRLFSAGFAASARKPAGLRSETRRRGGIRRPPCLACFV